MLKVWGRNTSSNVQKVMWAIGELGLEHERVDIGGKFGGNKEPAYLALNPNGLVPTLQDGDLTLWESNAGRLEVARARQPVDGLAALRGRARHLRRILGPDPHAAGAARPGGNRHLAGQDHRGDEDVRRRARERALRRRRGILDGRHSGRDNGVPLPPTSSRPTRAPQFREMVQGHSGTSGVHRARFLDPVTVRFL